MAGLIRTRLDRQSESRDDVPIRGTDCEVQVSKTTKRTYATESKMAVALEVARGEKTISQVASERGGSPSLVCEWRDQLEQSAGDVFGRTRQDRERRRSEEAAQRKYDEALRTIEQPAVERDFLQRFCDRNGYDPQKAR